MYKRHHAVLCVRANRKQTSRDQRLPFSIHKTLREQEPPAKQATSHKGNACEEVLVTLVKLPRKSPSSTTLSAGCLKPTAITFSLLADWYLEQVNILHDGPNDGQATGFCREGVNLVRAWSHVTQQTFNRIGHTNIAMHHLWEGIKGEQMLFIFTKATKRFGIALLVFGFESRSIEQRLLSSPT